MKEITLSKALKIKSKLAGDLSRAYTQLHRYNSIKIDHLSSEKVAEWAGKLDKITDSIETISTQLIEVKTAIARANVEVYPLFFKMNELKSKQSKLSDLPTSDGVVTSRSYSDTSESTYQAYYTEYNIDEMTLKISNDISELQDQIDTINATTKVMLSFS